MNFNDPIDSKDTKTITPIDDLKNLRDLIIKTTIFASSDQNEPKTTTFWAFKNKKLTIQGAHFINQVFGTREMNGRSKNVTN